MVVLLALLLTLLGALYLRLKWHYSYWARRQVASEPPTLFVGNMKGLGSKYHFKDVNQRLYRRFKGSTPFIGIYTFFTRSVIIFDLDLIKQIMVKDFSACANRGLFHNVRDDPLTGNLLFLDGEPWRLLRHKLSPVFTTGKLRYMFPTVLEVGTGLLESCAAIAGSANGALEAKDLCARYTTDVIGRCGFGIECNSLRDPEAEFRRMGRSISEEPRHSLLVQAFMFNSPEWARQLHLKHFSDKVNEFFMKAVSETVAYRERNNVRRNDFMDLLIELKAKRDQLGAGAVDSDDLANGLTLEQVAAQAMLFFLAGFETSSTTMSFCLYELALNTTVQEKLRQDIMEVLQRHNGVVSYESIKEMSYLDKVISETLRKYSVIPHIVRQTVTAYKLPNSNVTLEPGTRILIPIDALHNDPELYPSPEIFDPERFAPAAVAARNPFAYLPFGEGPRNCIGMRFGKLQVQIGLVVLLQRFSFFPTPETQVPVRYQKKSFLIASESGLHLRIEKI